MKWVRILGCAERGTGVARGEGQFSSGGPSDHRAGLVALSFLALSVSVWLRGLLASHHTGLRALVRMRLFLGPGVSFSLIRLSSVVHLWSAAQLDSGAG
jgi:hypothetical protein